VSVRVYLWFSSPQKRILFYKSGTLPLFRRERKKTQTEEKKREIFIIIVLFFAIRGGRQTKFPKNEALGPQVK
jgi:hypothetical protein